MNTISCPSGKCAVVLKMCVVSFIICIGTTCVLMLKCNNVQGACS